MVTPPASPSIWLIALAVTATAVAPAAACTTQTSPGQHTARECWAWDDRRYFDLSLLET